MRDLTVAIVNWNTKGLLEDCLRSIFDHTVDIEFEVCVVDNGSTDGSVQMVKERFPDVRLIENTANLGFAKANNQVLQECETRYALLLNSDTRVIDGALNELVSFMDAHPRAGAAGCRILNEDGSIQISCGRFPRLSSVFFGGVAFNNMFRKLFKNRTFFAEYGLSATDHEHVQDVDFVNGCALILRMDALSRTGFLDEKIFLYFEEIDLCYRIKQAGYSVLYTPDPRIVHLGGRSGRVFRDTVFRNLTSQEYFFRKHYGAGHAIAMRFVVALGSVLKLTVFAIMYPITNADARPAVKSKLIWNLYTLRWLVSGSGSN